MRIQHIGNIIYHSNTQTLHCYDINFKSPAIKLDSEISTFPSMMMYAMRRVASYDNYILFMHQLHERIR